MDDLLQVLVLLLQVIVLLLQSTIFLLNFLVSIIVINPPVAATPVVFLLFDGALLRRRCRYNGAPIQSP